MVGQVEVVKENKSRATERPKGMKDISNGYADMLPDLGKPD